MKNQKWVVPIEGHTRHLLIDSETGHVFIELHPAWGSVREMGGGTDESIVWLLKWPLGGECAHVYGLSNAKRYAEHSCAKLVPYRGL